MSRNRVSEILQTHIPDYGSKVEDIFHRSPLPHFPPEDVKPRTDETPKPATAPRKGGRGGNNTYGNRGTRKCHRCRKLKCKVRPVQLQDLTISVNMIMINQKIHAKDAVRREHLVGRNAGQKTTVSTVL